MADFYGRPGEARETVLKRMRREGLRIVRVVVVPIFLPEGYESDHDVVPAAISPLRKQPVAGQCDRCDQPAEWGLVVQTDDDEGEQGTAYVVACADHDENFRQNYVVLDRRPLLPVGVNQDG